ncbi:unnamed protein product [Brachionus calyciflorus]|uniref:Uncharacterized protein n=1 Tax=Brachionus calyciflorus TaxID=104777 RepID=A0A813XYS8_9BILA|nr:unnamed protein product [Brachionus calyciflorus]
MNNYNDLKTDNTEQIRVSYLNNDIKHIKQLTKNDCGPTCLKMAINYLYGNLSNDVRIERFQNVDKILSDLNLNSKSLWTIDIAHICAIEKINHIMYTVTLGVQDSYSSIDFYTEGNFTSEMLRIEQKFSNSRELGINVIKDSIDLNRIKFELNKNHVCIVLVDANLLNGKNIQMNVEELELNEIYNFDDISAMPTMLRPNCCFYPFDTKNETTSQTSKNDFDKIVESNIIKTSRSDFCGHYIILLGYDDTKQLIFYRNPASNHNFSYTSYLNFEIARKSFGTDQDILFIYPS